MKITATYLFIFMAIISKIRQYSWVAIFLIGFSVVAFVLADLLGPNGLGFLSTQDRNVGVINGENISYEEYDFEVNKLADNYRAMTTQSPDETQMANLREQAWNNLLFKKSYFKEFEKLGIAVTDKEMTQMVQGDSLFIHPWVRQQFTNQQTNQFDKAMLIQYLQQVAKMPPVEQMKWREFSDALRKERMRAKYEGLFKLSNYVTKAEAKNQYNAQNAKAEVKYLYIPYTSMADSVIAKKVTDGQLQTYLNKNKDKYKAQETRSLEYVVFDIKPSKKDSSAFFDEIKQLARDFAIAPNDSSFSQTNSDNPNPYTYQTVDKIPTVLFDKNPAILKGGIYGPYIDGKAYKIFKVSDEKKDSTEFVRASHILFKADKTSSEEDNAKAQKQANEILQKIKDGADFAEMARQYGTDGTAQQGGDLGWFSKGRMVKPFEDAAFATSELGLLPQLVKTDFGYHIIKITYPKTSTAYKMAIVDKVLDPSEETRNEMLRKAEELKSTSKSGDELRASIKKTPTLVLLKADKIQTTATALGSIQNARTIIRWAFKDAKIGDVSDVEEIQESNQYIIATLIGKTVKDDVSVDNFREELKAEVIKELKKEEILKKLPKTSTSLDEMAKKYGQGALINTATDITLGGNAFQNVGFAPLAIGKSFGLAKGKRTEPFADETGVFVLELVKITPASDIADYTQYKTQLKQGLDSRLQFQLNEAIKESAKITDKRYKFY